jgi:hypothetical protein
MIKRKLIIADNIFKWRGYIKRLVILIMLFIVISLSACQKEETEPIFSRQGRQVAESVDDN